MLRAAKHIGRKFNRLTIVDIKPAPKKDGRTIAVCKCDCGNNTEIRADLVVSGNNKSCGCLYSETRGQTNRIHGMWNSRTYRIWCGMKNRCSATYTGQKAHLYSEKGIRVCQRWRDSFEAFIEDMGKAPAGFSIERIDGNLGYEPGNCRWATPKEQANNSTRNKRIELDGETRTIAQWADKLGMKSNTLVYRVRRGWSPERALTTPVQERA